MVQSALQLKKMSSVKGDHSSLYTGPVWPANVERNCSLYEHEHLWIIPSSVPARYTLEFVGLNAKHIAPACRDKNAADRSLSAAAAPAPASSCDTTRLMRINSVRQPRPCEQLHKGVKACTTRTNSLEALACLPLNDASVRCNAHKHLALLRSNKLPQYPLDLPHRLRVFVGHGPAPEPDQTGHGHERHGSNSKASARCLTACPSPDLRQARARHR